jgi:hypothetical protein
MNDAYEPLEEKQPSLLREPTTLAAALALALAYFLGFYLLIFAGSGSGSDGSDAFLTFAFLIGGPAAAAAIAVRVSDPRGEASGAQHAGLGLVVAGLILGGGILLFGEGGLCTVMAAPFFIPCAVIAAVWTGRLCRRRGGRLSATVLPLLPLLVLQAEAEMEHPIAVETVVDSVVIDAAPAAIWAQLVEVRHIRPDELGWTFTQDVAGVPKPLDAALDRPGVGGVRHVRWGGGIRFGEEVTRWDEGRYLSWRFRFDENSIPAHVEQHVRVDRDYLSVDTGSYRLEPLPGGRTRLTLTTRYRLATGLNGYAAWWGRRMIGDFHRNVLKVIAGRAARRA